MAYAVNIMLTFCITHRMSEKVCVPQYGNILFWTESKCVTSRNSVIKQGLPESVFVYTQNYSESEDKPLVGISFFN